jgi:ribosomal protein S18 acetylase RimI-like enzyme
VNIAYRHALPEDVEFLYDLHRQTMQAYVEATWGKWDEEWQRARFWSRYAPRLLHVIQYKGQDVGVLQVQERAEELFLVIIEISPIFQGLGIGTAVIQDVLSEAVHHARPVALQVLRANIRARALYQRLGFVITGENATHYIMAKEVTG